jgi:MFS transporter, DHA1 family, multidrug resistance protein
VLGFAQWCAAGVVAPIAGLGGERTAVPMAAIVLVLVGVSIVAMRESGRGLDTAPASAPAYSTSDHNSTSEIH